MTIPSGRLLRTMARRSRALAARAGAFCFTSLRLGHECAEWSRSISSTTPASRWADTGVIGYGSGSPIPSEALHLKAHESDSRNPGDPDRAGVSVRREVQRTNCSKIWSDNRDPRLGNERRRRPLTDPPSGGTRPRGPPRGGGQFGSSPS